MMPTPPNSLEDVYLYLIGLGSESERVQWIEANLEDKPALREQVLKLLAARNIKGILDEPDPPLLQAGELIEDLSGEEVGPYLLLKPLGSGGMGDVYLAREREPVERLVAIKLLRLDVNIKADMRRFLRERQIMGGLQHPNIAQIFTAGSTEDGYSYIVMEYVEGTYLDRFCRERALPLRKRLELYLQCCRAIEHAHQKGVIHRDIKPSNVMVTEIGGVATVKVIDFGIAKIQEMAGEMESRSTRSSYRNDLVRAVGSDLITKGNLSPGTPPFMSPEQCSGDPALVDTRSDIYSLGALLYKLMTDRLPYDWEERPENTIRSFYMTAMTSAPKLPSRCAPHLEGMLKGDLDSIIGMAMQRDSGNRYASVGELVSDLNNHLEYRPVRANPLTVLQGGKKYFRRHRLALAAAGVAIGGLLVGLCLALVQSWRAGESERTAKSHAYASDMLLANMAIAQGDYAMTSEILERNRESSFVTDVITGREIQRLDWRLLKSQVPDAALELQRFEGKIYFGIAIPDRDELASGDNKSFLRVFSRLTPEEQRLEIQTEQKEINGLALSPDNRLIATAGDDGTVKFWDVSNGRLERTLRVSNKQVFQCKWTMDGRYFVTVANEPEAVVWSAADFQVVKRFTSNGRTLECMDIGPQGQVVYGSHDGIVRLGQVDGESTDTQELTLVPYRVINANRCSTVVFSPSGKLLGLGFNFGYMVLLREINGKFEPVERIRFPTTVTSIAFNRDESQAMVGEESGRVHHLKLRMKWPVKSTLDFRSNFFREYPDFKTGDGHDLTSLWDIVESASAGASRESIPLDEDRIFLKFSVPVPVVQFSESYVRTWFDESGESPLGWSEIPSAVVLKNEGVELQFANRFGMWTDDEALRREGRLNSRAPHRSRVSRVVWSGDEESLQTFSEEGVVCSIDIKRLGASAVESSNINQFLPLNNGEVIFNSNASPVYVLLSRVAEGPVERLFTKGMLYRIFSDPTHPDTVYGFQTGDEQEPHDQERTGESKVFRWAYRDKEPVEVPLPKREERVSEFLGATSSGRFVLRLLTPAEQIGNQEVKSYLHCWDPKEQKSVWSVDIPAKEIRALAQSRGGRYFGLVVDTAVYLLDGENGELHGSLEGLSSQGQRQHVLTLAFSPDDRYLAVICDDNSLQCVRVSDRQRIWGMQIPGGDALSMIWSRDGKTILTAARDGKVRGIDVDLRQVTMELSLFDRELEQIKISPEEDFLYLVNRTGFLYRVSCGSAGAGNGGK
jgi:serine/threonine protein kinase/WD40 repeat protein